MLIPQGEKIVIYSYFHEVKTKIKLFQFATRYSSLKFCFRKNLIAFVAILLIF